MKKRKINISGISKNLADSIKDEKSTKKYNKSKSLSNLRVAISVSDSEDLEMLGLSSNHLKDVSIEIARYLIFNGAVLIYGGDLRVGGYTELFSELSRQYKRINDSSIRIENYFTYPILNSIDSKTRASFLATGVKVVDAKFPELINENISLKTKVHNEYLIAKHLSKMREKMVIESDSRILIGGKVKNYKGFYPGIFEEAYYQLKNNKPLYIVGGFGGAARILYDIVVYNNHNEFTDEFQFTSIKNKKFRKTAQNYGDSNNFNDLKSFFKLYSLEKISSMNGLSVYENKILAESQNIHEIVFLLIQGLTRLKRITYITEK